MKHMGYGVINNEDRLIIHADMKKEDIPSKEVLDSFFPTKAPHKIVRVLIDEIEDDKKI